MGRKKRALPDEGVPAAGDTDVAGQEEDNPGLFRTGLADIIANREKEFEADTGVVPEDPEGLDEGVPVARKDAEEEAEDTPAEDSEAEAGKPEGKQDEQAPTGEADKPQEPVKAEAPISDDEEVELVVDGEKVKKKRSELIEIGRRAAQKELAADKRLEEATRLKREVEALREELTRSRRTPDEEPPDKPESTPDKPATNLDAVVAEKRKALREALNFGDEEDQERAQVEYEQALADMFQAKAGRQQATPPLDPDVLAEQIEIRMSHKSIAKRFTSSPDQGGFGDLWEEPEWKEAVQLEVDRAIQKGASGTDWNTYEQAGKKIRAYRDFLKTYNTDGTPPAGQPSQKGQARTPEVDSTLADRANRKRQVPSVPTATAKAAATEEEENTTDVIRAMAKKRGQLF